MSYKFFHKKYLSSILLALCLIAALTTISYAKELYNLSVTASVAPHYKVVANGEKLFIDTNMKVFINGEEVK